MLIAILGDTHLGARNASSHFSAHFNKFFTELFYPYLVEHGIKEVIQLGDLFDNRTTLSIKAYHACKSAWFDPLIEHGINMHILLGNHDIFYKSTLKVNTPELLLKNEYQNNINIIADPTVIDIDGTTIAMIPWICDENRGEVFDFMNRPKIADLCCGHFEINGFEMQRGVAGHGGLPRELFERFELTLSGHYHTRSSDETYRINYVGTPYEITFADIHDPRGFHVFDTETRKLTFIENKSTMFERILYNEGWNGNVQDLAGLFVKLVVEKKTDLYAFDRFVDSIKLAGVYELQIIENFNDMKNIDVDGEVIVGDSISIINNYIDNLTTAVDKDRLKDYMSGIYHEAIAT